MHAFQRSAALALAAVVAAAGCKGKDGAAGANGANGLPGPTIGNTSGGSNSISGKLTFTGSGACAGAQPAAGAIVGTVPDAGVTATTAADGSFSLSVPYGAYTALTVSGADYAYPPQAQTTIPVPAPFSVGPGDAGAVVFATPFTVARVNPLYACTTVTGAPGTLDIPKTGVSIALSIVGATGTPTVTVTQTAGPSTLPLTGTATPYTVDVPSLDVMLASGKLPALQMPRKPGFVGLSPAHLAVLTAGYKYTFKVFDPGSSRSTTAMAAIPIKGFQVTAGATQFANTATVPAVQKSTTLAPGLPVIASDPGSTTWSWTLTPASGSTLTAASLKGATTQTPWFTPDVAGTWTLVNGATTLTVYTDNYQGLTMKADGTFDTTAGCFVCHADKAVVATSRHLNHFQNTATGGQQVDAFGVPLPVETLFNFGLNGGEGSHYSGRCVTCHTTGGYAPAVANGGYYSVSSGSTIDAAYRSSGGAIKIPVPNGIDYWNLGDPMATPPVPALPQPLKNLAGMQCEACHGARKASGHTTVQNIPWDVQTCAVCHDRPANHDRVYLWSLSPTGHSNQVLAARGEGPTAGDCARCHTAQGFAAVVDSIQAGTGAGPLASGLPLNTAQPQTCQACHDPHTTTLRIQGDVKALPNGFSVTSVGASAVCMVCHNGRSTAAMTGNVGIPHHATQMEVIFGVNAFSFSGTTASLAPGSLSRHAAVADVCVGCHVKLHPASIAVSGTNHTFQADTTICASCHGAQVNGEAIAGYVQGQVAKLQANLQAGILAQITAWNTLNGSYDLKTALDVGSTTTTLTVAPTSVTLNGSFHGQPAWDVVVGTTTYNVVLGGILQTGSTTVQVVNRQGNFARALWNYEILASDKSNGIHNPTYVYRMLAETTALDLTNVANF